MSSNQLNDISKVYMEAVYGGGKKEEKDTRMVVTNADKKANTPAYQAYKAGKTSVKTGKPLYKAADHLKDNYEFARHKASVISRGGRLEDAVESWNQKVAYQEAMKEVSEKKEVNVKDTYKTVAAIVDYDRAKKGSKDATYDSMKGDKEAAKKERDYAAWERSKMKKDDPNWKSKKYHTGMHGESYETTKTKEVMGALKKRDLKQDEKKKIAADIVKKKGDTSKSDDRYAYEERRWQDDDGDGKWYEKSDVDGKISKREKKAKKHDCASKVKHEQFGIGNPVKGMHDLDESGNVVHYDVLFDHGVEKNVPVTSLEILEESMHEHVIQGDVIEQKKPKNCGCGQDPCITYGKKDKDDTIEEDADKLASKAYDRAKTLGARRRSSYEYRKKGSFGPGKNERAGYNLSQSQASRNRSPETQGGNQTGGGAKSFGFAKNKSNPIKSKSVYDSGAVGHRKKRDEKVTTKKDGKTPLKTPRYKMSSKQRIDHHSSRRQELRDPKKNPKHTANK